QGVKVRASGLEPRPLCSDLLGVSLSPEDRRGKRGAADQIDEGIRGAEASARPGLKGVMKMACGATERHVFSGAAEPEPVHDRVRLSQLIGRSVRILERGQRALNQADRPLQELIEGDRLIDPGETRPRLIYELVCQVFERIRDACAPDEPQGTGDE